MPFSRGFVGFFGIFVLLAYAGVGHLIAGDASIGRLLINSATATGYLALACQTAAWYARHKAKRFRPVILR